VDARRTIRPGVRDREDQIEPLPGDGFRGSMLRRQREIDPRRDAVGSHHARIRRAGKIGCRRADQQPPACDAHRRAKHHSRLRPGEPDIFRPLILAAREQMRRTLRSGRRSGIGPDDQRILSERETAAETGSVGIVKGANHWLEPGLLLPHRPVPHEHIGGARIDQPTALEVPLIARRADDHRVTIQRHGGAEVLLPISRHGMDR